MGNVQLGSVLAQDAKCASTGAQCGNAALGEHCAHLRRCNRFAELADDVPHMLAASAYVPLALQMQVSRTQLPNHLESSTLARLLRCLAEARVERDWRGCRASIGHSALVQHRQLAAHPPIRLGSPDAVVTLPLTRPYAPDQRLTFVQASPERSLNRRLRHSCAGPKRRHTALAPTLVLAAAYPGQARCAFDPL